MTASGVISLFDPTSSHPSQDLVRLAVIKTKLRELTDHARQVDEEFARFFDDVAGRLPADQADAFFDELFLIADRKAEGEGHDAA